MFDTRSEPYQAWKAFGRVVEAAKPRGLVVVSAHWEHPHNTSSVQGEHIFPNHFHIIYHSYHAVNNDLTNPLIYDFGGFPKHYYRETFTSRGNEEMLQAVVGSLQAGGIGVEQVPRGPDHGVWGEYFDRYTTLLYNTDKVSTL